MGGRWLSSVPRTWGARSRAATGRAFFEDLFPVPGVAYETLTPSTVRRAGIDRKNSLLNGSEEERASSAMSGRELSQRSRNRFDVSEIRASSRQAWETLFFFEGE
jgi:hypothetical protein